MRLRFHCYKCDDPTLRAVDTVVTAPVNDAGIYNLVCLQGHDFVATTQNKRYEHLFEIGLSAILDDYYREAISSFSASLERFYEFATRVFASHAQIDASQFEATWKHMSRQSERQLGAYAASYLLSVRDTPIILAETFVSLRNEVIHKGKIPSREEAIAFGDSVVKVIHPALRVLRSQFADATNQVGLAEEQRILHTPALYGVKLSRHSFPLMLRDLDTSGPIPDSLSSRIERMRAYYSNY